jgi:acetyltransferase-like isoleucine patch superfamily enzyme
LYYRLAFWLVRWHVRGKNNQVLRRGALLKNVRFDIRGSDNRIEIAPGAELRNVTFRLCGDNHSIKLGAGCRINRSGMIWFEDERGSLDIGQGTTIEEAHIAVTEPGSRIQIGADCLLAYDIDIRCGDSHSLLESASGRRINPAEDVSIGDHVWIAAHARILKGVRIAADSVVATGAVVVQPCETPGVVLGGNPAKVIRQGIIWSRERKPL